MESKLKFLTTEDYNLLREKAKVAVYPKHDIIVKEGSSPQRIYILQKGIVRVEKAAVGTGVAIAFLEPGDIFGEMSFLEEAITSAKIVAQDTVEVLILEQNDLYSLLVSVPGLSARFYQSLAYSLSWRLRETTSLVASLTRKISTYPYYENRRTGSVGQDRIPPDLIGELELFKHDLWEVEQNIRAKKITEEMAQETVNRICGMIANSLREQIIHHQDLEKAIGTYIFRETFVFFMLSSFIDLAYRQPRSCANDSYIVEILSQNEPEGDGHLGIYIDRWIRSIPTCLALKSRGGIITATLKELAIGWSVDNPMPVTSLASGVATEISDLFFHTEPPNVHVTCIDLNHQHLAYAANLSRKLEFQDYLTFIQDNIYLIAEGHSSINIAPQQMIYSVTMGNYLSDRELIAVLDWIYDRLLPNGTVILGNFHSSNPDRLLLEHILEWHLIYRSAEQLEKLFGRSKFRSLPVNIESDEFGVELFAVCTKSWNYC
jgi:extracellular factor (EF) 3-hydroxypalmitic acid methyl ester biosynthesis protein